MTSVRQRKRDRREGFEEFTKLLAGDTEEAGSLRDELEDPLSPENSNGQFATVLYPYVQSSYTEEPSARVLFSDYLSYFNKLDQEDKPFLILHANAVRERASQDRSWQRYSFVKRILVNPSSKTVKARREKLHDAIPTYRVVSWCEEEEYPPRNVWLYDCQLAGLKWREHISTGKQPDQRVKRKEMHKVDPSKLDYDIKAGESARFVNEQGELVMLIIRDFCASDKMTQWADAVANRNVDVRKSIRLEDAGSIVMSGWSAGSRSSPNFHWVKNLRRRIGDDEDRKLAYEGSSAFALLWNLARGLLPPIITSDFDEFISSSGIYRMDPGAIGGGRSAEYTVPTEDGEITFKNAEMAPPCGVFARNYARATHNEVQPHKWAIAWTTKRKGYSVDGGHFYNCRYRIRVQGGHNTLVAWQPSDFHATSLQNVDPHDENPSFVQSGLAIVTSPRIRGVFEKYWAKKITATEAVEECFTEGYQDEEISAANV
ncbi:hypothetical protein VNI00_003694 [Paramarasmius palmivorus]|uniref:Uncharacterized protein n=1 Tax=Paramarasmius palmivorus TaxID=297713 RepID=A0AAW0DTQ4_9AGAR